MEVLLFFLCVILCHVCFTFDARHILCEFEYRSKIFYIDIQIRIFRQRHLNPIKGLVSNVKQTSVSTCSLRLSFMCTLKYRINGGVGIIGGEGWKWFEITIIGGLE